MVRWDMFDFCAWLCEVGERALVGSAYSRFCSPLSQYLKDRVGQPYYVDGLVYGPMAADVSWELPYWAQQLYRLFGSRPLGPLTAEEVFDLLAIVECL